MFKKSLIFYLSILLVLAPFGVDYLRPTRVKAATTNIDANDSANYSFKFTGVAGSLLGLGETQFADVDNNGVKDIILEAGSGDFNGRSGSGSIYIIFDSLWTTWTKGTTISLGTSTNYNLRYDGAVASDTLGRLTNVVFADIDLNGRTDLIMTAPAGGKVYVVYDSLIGTYSGTGNNIDLSVSTNYNILYSPINNNILTETAVAFADMTKDGLPDLILPYSGASFNGRALSGSVYIIDNSLVRSKVGTGNSVALGTTTNFTLRIDAPLGSALMASAQPVDYDGNGFNDLFLGAPGLTYSGRANAGGVFYINDSIIGANVSGTGNLLDLATTSNYNFLLGGSAASDRLSGAAGIMTGDFDGDGKKDLLVNVQRASFNSRSFSGAFYLISGALLASSLTTTANSFDMATSTSYTSRFDGAATNDRSDATTRYSASGMVADYDNDGHPDVLLGFFAGDFTGRTDPGNIYIVNSSIFRADFGTTGHTYDLLSSTSSTFLYYGPSSSEFGDYLGFPTDMDGDGSIDFAFNAWTTETVFVIRNFPHTITLNTGNTITGTVSAPDSVTTIANVQYSTTASATGTWTDCTADDGSFNGASEAFSCGTGLNSGDYYIRAADSHAVYSAVSHYAHKTLTGSSSVSTSSASASSSSISSTTITMTAPRYSTNGTVTVTGTYTDSPASITIRGINGVAKTATLSNGTFTATLTNVAQGTYQFSALSDSNNASNAVAGNLTTVDLTPPQLSVVDPETLTSESSTVVAGRVTDYGYSTLDRLTLVNTGTALTYPVKFDSLGMFSLSVKLIPGNNRISLIVYDQAGNNSSEAFTVNYNPLLLSTPGQTMLPFVLSTGKTIRLNPTAVLAYLQLNRGKIDQEKAVITPFQQRLYDLVFMTTKPNGFFNLLTLNASRAFQRSVGLNQTNILTAHTLAYLFGLGVNDLPNYIKLIRLSRSGYSQKELEEARIFHLTKDLKANQKDEEVKFIQKKLYLFNYYSGPINGWLNQTTQDAIKQFRKDRTLKDGLVDQQLRDKLNNL